MTDVATAVREEQREEREHSNEICRNCQYRIRVMIFRGSGLCSVGCQKEWAVKVYDAMLVAD